MVMREKPILKVRVAGRELEFHPVDESPCRRACPAGIDVKRYVGQIANGDFAGALATIRKHMPFPSACGRICLHPCENECKRGEIDKPVAIMHLKRFVHEYESRKGESEPLPKIPKSTGRKIAVVGSGPAGLTAAHDLALMGHKVTVLERSDKPGGMLTHAIPEFELPSSAVMKDIERIEKLGVEIKCGHPIRDENELQGLLVNNFDAVLLATGSGGRWNGFDGSGWIPGGDHPCVVGAVEFMSKNHVGSENTPTNSPGKVLVLGWGVQALASARTAIRLDCPDVKWIVPIAKDHLQPDKRLILQAEEEGVEILELTRPIAIETSGEGTRIRVVGLEPGDVDHTGRIDFIEKTGGEKIISCDTVIDAAHFIPDTNWDGFSNNPWGTVQVEFDTMATSMPGIFAAGDVVSGPKSVVEAVSLGHRAAEGINRFLTDADGEIGTLSSRIKISAWELDDPAGTPSDVYRPSVRPVNKRITDFVEVEQPFSAWQATHEACRCLLCGPCEECAVCIPTCYRKRGMAQDEDGLSVPIRVPLVVAKGIRDETIVRETSDVKLFAAVVNPALCRGCGVCEEICGYHAPRIAPDPKYGFVSTIDILACKGCGTCVAACPSGAVDQGITSLSAIRYAIKGGR